jgi:hypothetical protein
VVPISPLGGGAVVADDVVDERVVEDPEVCQRVDDAADVVVGVLQERGVDLHLSRQHRLEVLGLLVPAWDLLRPRGQLALRRDHAHLLLARERLLAQDVPALIELALVLVDPLRRHVVRSVGRTGSEVAEERLVGVHRLLLAQPQDGPVGQVGHQVIAVLRQAPRFHWHRLLIQRRVELVVLAADEAVEVLKAAAGMRPVIKRTVGTGLEHRHLVALADLRRRVAVESEHLRQRRARVRAERVVSRRRRRDLRDPTHPDRSSSAACTACRRTPIAPEERFHLAMAKQ